MSRIITALRVAIVLGPQDEVVGLPAGGERDADAAARQVVDDRPFLDDARG